ncbi:MAG: single-stranded DNA-binding protein [Thermodesulfobacteriota bacterium]
MAGSMNKVILIGRLGQDPKLTYLPSGAPVTEFTVATDESFKNRDGQKEERTEWHRIKVFGKQAEICSNYLSKGRLVYIEGSIRTRSWDDQQGQKRYITEIVVSAPGHTIQFLEGRGGGVEAAPMEGGYQGGYQGGQQGGYQNGGYQNGGQQGAPQGGYGGQGQARGQQRPPQQQQRQQQPREEDLGPAFPSEASGMDDVPF